MRDKADLYPYQVDAVEHIITNNGSMLWVGIGLGKTAISLTAIEHLLDSYQVSAVLVVSTVKVVEAVWAQEAKLWSHTKRLKFSLVRGTPEQRLKALQVKADVYLINYDNLEWLAAKGGKKTIKKKDAEGKITHKEITKPEGVLHTYWLKQKKALPFDMVVFDEISKMKHATSNRCRAFCKVLPHFVYRVGLTGTPATNGVADLHGQYLMVDGGHRLGPNVTGFRSRWFIQNEHSRKWAPRRGAPEEIQQRIADITLEMKTEDYMQLPPIIERDWELDLPETVLEQYKQFEKEFFVAFDGGEVEAMSVSAKSIKCRQLANGAVYTNEDRTAWAEFHDIKMEALEELMQQVKSPILLCYQFIHDKERIMKKFPKAVHLDSKDVNKKVEAWNRGEIKLMIGHPLSMAHGLNLQFGGNHMVWFGLPWDLEHYIQALGRIARNGQKGEVIILHRLLAKNTIEEAIREALGVKDADQNALREAVKQYRLSKGV